MNSAAQAISDRPSRPADKRGLQTIGLLFVIATLIVIGAAGLAIRSQLGMPSDVIERAVVSLHTTSST